MSFSIYVSNPVLFFLKYIQNINYPDNLNGKGTSDLSIRSNKEDAILGKWITVEKNLEVEVYKKDNRFKANIIWFKYRIQPATYTRMDERNPNPALRSQKWLGMDVLRKLKYNADDNEWQDGIIYDPSMDANGILLHG